MPSASTGAARLARPALALGGGLLTALSLPPWGFWPLAIVGVVVFDVALGRDPSRRCRATCGFAFGAGWMFMGMAWMWFLTVPGYLVAGTLFAALHAGAAVLAPSGRWGTIGRSSAHTLAESVRLVFPFGGIPLATLGISQADGPLLGLARVGGVVLITWVVFQLGFGLAAILPAIRDRTTVPSPLRSPAAVALVGVAVIGVAAVLAPEGADMDRPPMTIAAVQGGGEQGTSALDVPSSQVTRAHLDATETIEPNPELDLVVWPENAIDVDDEPFAGSTDQLAVATQAARLDVPFAVGVTEDSEFSSYPSDEAFVNAQVVVAPDGEVTSRYEKVRRVPFGEFVPFRGLLETVGAPLDQIPSDAVAGQDPPVIVLPDGTDLGVMISWEVFFGNLGRAASADGSILLNPTNGASYTGTILQTQQVASSRLRAVENGRWVVQVSPTGFSAFVSPDGDVFQRTNIGEQAVITRDIALRDGTTWYGTLGDWPWIVAVVAVFALARWLSRPVTPRAAG